MLLLAIDDLDFAAKLHSSDDGGARRADVAGLIERMTPALREVATDRSVDLEVSPLPRAVVADVEPELADRLIFRMCIALIEQAGPGERLRLTVEPSGERWRVSMTPPARLVAMTDEPLGGEADTEHGFSLRLLRGLARIAGASVEAAPARISLLFARA